MRLVRPTSTRSRRWCAPATSPAYVYNACSPRISACVFPPCCADSFVAPVRSLRPQTRSPEPSPRTRPGARPGARMRRPAPLSTDREDDLLSPRFATLSPTSTKPARSPEPGQQHNPLDSPPLKPIGDPMRQTGLDDACGGSSHDPLSAAEKPQIVRFGRRAVLVDSPRRVATPLTPISPSPFKERRPTTHKLRPVEEDHDDPTECARVIRMVAEYCDGGAAPTCEGGSCNGGACGAYGTGFGSGSSPGNSPRVRGGASCSGGDPALGDPCAGGSASKSMGAETTGSGTSCTPRGRARGPDALSRLLDNFEKELPPLAGMPERRGSGVGPMGPMEKLRTVAPPPPPAPKFPASCCPRIYLDAMSPAP